MNFSLLVWISLHVGFSRLAGMLPTIYEDALAHPTLFHWFGASESEFDVWLATLPLRVHTGLAEFWRSTGGGDLFESETILGPLAQDESDNVLKMNEYHWNKGLPRDMLIFHTGLNMSASVAGRRRHRLVLLQPDTYEVEKSFDTFDAWYRRNLRAEYADRYGLQHC